MPSAQDGLPSTQFGDIRFPGEMHTVEAVYRHHVFEYPHTPGGKIEKLGRSLYKVTIRANFQATFPNYPDLYPNSMNTMRQYFEQGQTLPFVHPTLPNFQAMITDWRQVKDAKLLSGEKVDITFLEDQAQQFALGNNVTSVDDTTIGPSAERLQQELDSVRQDLALTDSEQSLFDAIQHTVTSILAIGDTVNLYANDYSAKLQQLGGLCSQLESAASMQDPRAWPVVNQLLDLWAGANQALQDVQAKQLTTSIYIVEQSGMTMTDIAVAIYDDASRAGDLIGLNPGVADSLNVPILYQIKFYPDS